jgi:hypothetical protein
MKGTGKAGLLLPENGDKQDFKRGLHLSYRRYA